MTKKIKKTKKTQLNDSLGTYYGAPLLNHIQEHVRLLKSPTMAKTIQPIRRQTWFERLTINLKGGVWVGIFTLTMWAGVVNAMFLEGKDIPDGVIWVYGTILTAFAGTKVVGKFVNGKNGQPVEED